MRIDETGPDVKVKVEHSVTRRRLCDLLTCAVEGGTGYWASLDIELAPGITRKDVREGGRFTDPGEYQHPYEIAPFIEGCYLLVCEFEAENQPVHRVGIAQMQRALEIMAERYPRHLARFLEEREDADDGDVFLQCAALGEVVYG